MRHLLCLAVLAACGGSQKSTTPPPPLPETKTEPVTEAKPNEQAQAKKEPEPPPGPVEITVAAPKVAVKLVSPGKGKRAPLKLTSKQGSKQKVELVFDFTQKQGDQEAAQPTLVFSGDAETKAVDAAGAIQFELATTEADVRVTPAQGVPPELITKLKAVLKDLKFIGGVAANGAADDLKLRLEMADPRIGELLKGLKLEMLPIWPVLPTEPVGVGAKWQEVATSKLADQLDVTVTTDYELVDHKGNTWTIKGATKVTGADQTLEGDAKLSNISGTGTIEVAMVDGALYPKTKHELATGFTASGTGPDKKPMSLQFGFKQMTQVTPK